MRSSRCHRSAARWSSLGGPTRARPIPHSRGRLSTSWPASASRYRWSSRAVTPVPDVSQYEQPVLSTGLSDEALAVRSVRDSDAFGELYCRYRDRVYGFVRRRLGDDDTAAEVTAIVFESALRSIDRYKAARGPFAAWIMTIARNAAVDHHRRRPIGISPRFATRKRRIRGCTTDPKPNH